MGATAAYSSLLEDLVAAPGSVEHWQAFLLHLCDALNGTAASFISIDSRSQDAQITITARTDPEALADYQRHWQKFDPWAHGIMSSRPVSGAILFGEQFVGPSEMKRTPFYNDFGRHHGITQCIAGMIEVTPSTFSCLSIDRGDERAPFDKGDGMLLDALMPHLQRALHVHRRLCTAELMASNMADVVNGLAHGVLLLSPAGRIVFANRLAEEMLAARDGLMSDGGELRTATAASTGQLHQAISEARLRSADGTATPTMLLPRPSGRRPLVAVISPLPRTPLLFALHHATVAVFVTDPERRPAPDVEALRATLHLTAGEAMLVRCLVQGLTLDAAATALGVRLGTIRTRLKTILHKTGTHRQSELVGLVRSSLPPT